MESHQTRTDQSLKALIELGKKGMFPLFERTWIDQYFTNPILTKNKKQKTQIDKMFSQLSKHKTIERKKTLLFAMTEQERNLLIREFFQMVEGKILDEGPELH